MSEYERPLTLLEKKSHLYGKLYGTCCLGIFFLILSGFFRGWSVREEILFLLFFLVMSFYLWWLPYDTKASHPELTTGEVIKTELKNPAIIAMLLAMLVFVPSAIYALIIS